jgi:hypothetical protein
MEHLKIIEIIFFYEILQIIVCSKTTLERYRFDDELFDFHVTVHRVKFLIINPTRCTNFSNFFLEWNSTCFGQFLCQSSGGFHCTHSNGICHTGLLTDCEQAVNKPVWHIPLLCVQWKTPDDGQRDCPKHAEFHSKKKLEKLVHLVGYIIRITCVILVQFPVPPRWSKFRSCAFRYNRYCQLHLCVNIFVAHVFRHSER